MNKYIITSETTADLSKEHFESIGVKYICFHYELDGKELIEEKFVNLKGKVLINNIGTTIGSHTGPWIVALFFYGEQKEKIYKKII